MSDNRFHVEEVEGAQIILLELPRLLDSEEFDLLNESILAHVDGKSGERWIIDLTHVDYMGSAMLGLMVNLRQRIRGANGRLALCCVPHTLQQIFKACSLERLFVFAKTRADAIKLTR